MSYDINEDPIHGKNLSVLEDIIWVYLFKAFHEKVIKQK